MPCKSNAFSSQKCSDTYEDRSSDRRSPQKTALFSLFLHFVSSECAANAPGPSKPRQGSMRWRDDRALRFTKIGDP